MSKSSSISASRTSSPLLSSSMFFERFTNHSPISSASVSEEVERVPEKKRIARVVHSPISSLLSILFFAQSLQTRYVSLIGHIPQIPEDRTMIVSVSFLHIIQNERRPFGAFALLKTLTAPYFSVKRRLPI